MKKRLLAIALSFVLILGLAMVPSTPVNAKNSDNCFLLSGIPFKVSNSPNSNNGAKFKITTSYEKLRSYAYKKDCGHVVAAVLLDNKDFYQLSSSDVRALTSYRDFGARWYNWIYQKMDCVFNDSSFFYGGKSESEIVDHFKNINFTFCVGDICVITDANGRDTHMFMLGDNGWIASQGVSANFGTINGHYFASEGGTLSWHEDVFDYAGFTWNHLWFHYAFGSCNRSGVKVFRAKGVKPSSSNMIDTTSVSEQDVNVQYTTHIQNFGWSQGWATNGKASGTSGMSYRLEGIKIKIDSDKNLGVKYTTHVENYGWRFWSRDGEMSGTSGESKRLEAIKIKLTGADADNYSIYYRVHAQNYGWLGWAKDGQAAGTAGKSLRLEAIQIVVLPKSEAAPGNTFCAVTGSKYTEPYYANNGLNDVEVSGFDSVNISYRTHVQNVGWQNYVTNGAVAGTSGRSLRLEGINIELANLPYSGGIEYRTHIQNIGWESSWKSNGAMSGTSGRSLRLEAIQIRLTGEMANYYDVFYRVHAQNIGWMSWAKNGEEAGTAGHSYRLEAIQIMILPKGQVPANDFGGIVPKTDKAFVE